MGNYIFTKWEIANDESEVFSFEKVLYSEEKLRVFLKANSQKGKSLEITFKEPLVYQLSEDGILLRDWHIFENTNINCFFKSECSAYLNMVKHYSYGLHLPENLVHYGINTEDACIDVLTANKPSIQWH